MEISLKHIIIIVLLQLIAVSGSILCDLSYDYTKIYNADEDYNAKI